MSDKADFNIEHIADLARIELTAEEKAKFSSQLGEVLGHIAQLKKVDVSKVEPTSHAMPIVNVWQEDVVEPGFTAEEALRNAPAQKDNMVVVPKVVE